MAAAGFAFAFLAAIRIWLTVHNRRWLIGKQRDGTDVIVRRGVGGLELVLRDGTASLVQSRSSGGGYVDWLHAPMLLEPRPACVLFLGGGAGIAPRQFEKKYPDVTMDVVEKEPLVIAAAAQHFGLKPTRRLSLHTADAIAFVESAPDAAYDAVVLDCYDAHGIPPLLTREEFFRGIRRVLKETGSFVANLIKDSEAARDASLAAIRAVFPNTQTFELAENTIVVAAPAIPDDLARKIRANEGARAPA
jgi:spermidine synthase